MKLWEEWKRRAENAELELIKCKSDIRVQEASNVTTCKINDNLWVELDKKQAIIGELSERLNTWEESITEVLSKHGSEQWLK